MSLLVFVGKEEDEHFAGSHAAAGRMPDVTFAVIPGKARLSAILRHDQVLPRVAAFLE
jgi:hypothetical protein